MNAIHWAALNGHSVIVDILIKSGVKPDTTDKVSLLILCKIDYEDIVLFCISFIHCLIHFT